MTSLLINRRNMVALMAGSAAASTLGAGTASAKAPMLGALKPSVYRFTLGKFEVTTFSDGIRTLDNIGALFGKEADDAEMSALLGEHFLSASARLGFTPTLVNTGNELVLFDTGLGAGARPAMGTLASQLAASGVTPDLIDIVVLTHMHPDHIGGLMEDGSPAFPNARYITGSTEYNFWSDESRMTGPTERVAKLVAGNVTPLAEKMSFIKGGDSVVSGIEAVEAFGHTPGHMTYHLESEGRRLMLTADTANHYVLSLLRPEWPFQFDGDKTAAGAARRNLFGMIAADRIPFVGYHMPFPSVGFVETVEDGFRYVPSSYQMDL